MVFNGKVALLLLASTHHNAPSQVMEGHQIDLSDGTRLHSSPFAFIAA